MKIVSIAISKKKGEQMLKKYFITVTIEIKFLGTCLADLIIFMTKGSFAYNCSKII